MSRVPVRAARAAAIRGLSRRPRRGAFQPTSGPSRCRGRRPRPDPMLHWCVTENGLLLPPMSKPRSSAASPHPLALTSLLLRRSMSPQSRVFPRLPPPPPPTSHTLRNCVTFLVPLAMTCKPRSYSGVHCLSDSAAPFPRCAREPILAATALARLLDLTSLHCHLLCLPISATTSAAPVELRDLLWRHLATSARLVSRARSWELGVISWGGGTRRGPKWR